MAATLAERTPAGLQIVQIAALAIRAALSPATVDEGKRTVELIFSTGAAVDRYDWMSGKRYIEKLSLDPKHIQLDRLNAGGPLLDTHGSYSVRDQLGAVVPGSAKSDGKQATAVVKFSRRADVEPVWQDVRDGVLRNVSVGYRVYRYEEVAGKGDAPSVRTATLWQPFEVSLVPMPADMGAQVRGDKQVGTFLCELLVRADDAGDADRLIRLARARAL